MSPFYSFNFLVAVVFAIFFYRAAQFDGGSELMGIFWASLSVAMSLLVWQWLRWGVFAMLFGQIALFVGIGVYRVIRKE